ncbi:MULTISPECIES: hypothetical protein [Sphingomonas]|uniref:hypothetical protein n=1 Tax=Sphingomonas TaxID=13687 RepID=UPI000DEF0239|nr:MULTISPECIES: hypothetical protein [Sphingomonas]
MDAHGEQIRQNRAAATSAMLLSMLFSLWLAIGGVGAGTNPVTPEYRGSSAPKAVVLQAGSGKQVQQPRQPEPTAALPGASAPLLTERLTYPAGAQPLALAAPRAFAGAADYQARAPPAR